MKKLVLILGLLGLAVPAFAIDGIPTMNSLTRTSFTVTTHTATVVSLSTVARLSTQPLTILFSSRGPSAAFYWDVFYSANTFTAYTLGHYTAASTTATLLDKLDPNLCLVILSTGTTDTTLNLNVFGERK